MEFRDFTKSVLALPWAMSMFGLQQVANLMAPPSREGVTGAAAAFDAVSDATEQQLDGWLKQAYDVGTGVQGALLDLMMLRTPDVDPSVLMRAAGSAQAAPIVDAVMRYGMPPVGWLDSFLVPPRDAPAVQQEFANKLYVIRLVTQVHRDVDGPRARAATLAALVQRVAAKESFPRLWATEGLGNYYGDRAIERSDGSDPVDLLSGRGAVAVPAWSLTMLHAGIGMSFAKDVLARLQPASPPDATRGAVARFIALCTKSSRAGYAGCALESLGLTARTLYPTLITALDREIPNVDPELHGYFWHGAGRAMYFDPMNMLPSANAPWRAVRRLQTEAPHDLARRNVLAGLAWAITLVNMRNPIVMETFLRHHLDSAARDGAFTNGVTSAMMMRFDTTPDDIWIEPFIHHVPRDPDTASAWRALIGTPCAAALRGRYPELQRAAALEELFHYRPQPA